MDIFTWRSQGSTKHREQVPVLNNFSSLWLCPIDQNNSHVQAQSQCEREWLKGREGNYLCKQLPQYPITGVQVFRWESPRNCSFIREVPHWSWAPHTLRSDCSQWMQSREDGILLHHYPSCSSGTWRCTLLSSSRLSYVHSTSGGYAFLS